MSTSRRDASSAPPERTSSAPQARRRRARRDWPGLLLRPHVLIGAMALVAAVPYLVGSFASNPVDNTLPSLSARTSQVQREVEMPLVLVTPDGGTRTEFELVRSADHEAARWTATLAALREALVAEGVWPSEVDAPRVTTFEANRRRVAVVDVSVSGRVAVSAADEWAALRSMVETMRAAGADDVRVIVDGAPADTLWGEVALP